MSSNAPPPPAGFPPPNFPVVFADGVLSLGNSADVVKLYLSRTNPEFQAYARTEMQPFMQLVMPMTGFAQTAVFFSIALDRFVSQGLVKEADLKAIRESLMGLPQNRT